MSNLVPIFELNELSYEEFINTINILFEPAPPLAKALYSFRPFTSYTSLISFATNFVQNTELPLSQKLEIINAHPRLGENKKNLSSLSLKEQGYSSQSESDIVDEDEIINTILQELNNKYEEIFGFRFIIFVNGRSRKEIIPILQDKIANGNKNEELERSLMDMMNIATDRLKKLGRD
jgi:2-oxo-4-hydroxy-4-carboxy--5-ureidoimidazoline (OHCU) decarboxylase